MIAELRIRDLATIADVTLTLGPGLNLLTGETGAGKSMLVDALGLLLGGRADSGAIRPGTSRAVVEGVFEDIAPALVPAIEAMGLDLEDQRLVVKREIAAEGRSRAWVNGSPVSVGVLGSLGGLLVDLHGQHETHSLLRSDTQRDLLDAFAEAVVQRDAVGAAVAELRDLRAREADLLARREEVTRRADYLRHVVREIDAARLKPGEEDAIDAEARKLRSVEQLTAGTRNVSEALDGEAGSALHAIGQAERALAQLERLDPATSAWRELLDAAYNSLSELARVVRDYEATLEDDPDRLASLEARRDILFRLKQKHGTTLELVLETRRRAGEELDLLDTADLDLRTLAARKKGAEVAVAAAAAGLTASRTAAGDRLARGVNRLLPKLGLAGGKLSVVLAALPEPGSAGAESVVFMIQLNAGMEARPLAKVASGGELSRLMLALKVVLARHDAVPSLVFDEVDQGIGGEVGSQVGSALADVAARHQVLVITHLPQIAARADRHLVVSKRDKGGVATSDVAVIHGEDRVAELARMLGDPDGDTARRHAMSLLGR